MFGLETFSQGVPYAAASFANRAMRGRVKPMADMCAGIAAGTRIATASGNRAVEAITEGDLVLTFDSGLRPVRAVVRGAASDQPNSPRPLYVPPRTLGNAEAFFLMPEQAIIVESDSADLVLGNPFATLRASELEGFRGIERVTARDTIEAVQLLFDDDEVVFAASGALFVCSTARTVPICDVVDGQAAPGRYRTLSGEEAQLLVECMREEDTQTTVIHAA